MKWSGKYRPAKELKALKMKCNSMKCYSENQIEKLTLGNVFTFKKRNILCQRAVIVDV